MPAKHRNTESWESRSGLSVAGGFLCAGVSSVLLLFSAAPQSRSMAAEPSSPELVEAVIAGIHGNFSQLQAFQAKIATVVESKSSPRPDSQINLNSPVLRPAEAKSVVIGRGNNLRVEFLGFDDKSKEPIQTIAVVDGVSTDYAPGERHAWIRPLSGLSDSLDLDPRAFGIRKAVGSYQEFLREGKLLDASIVKTGSTPEVSIKLERLKNRTVSLRFDPAHNYLPSMIAFNFADGSINTLATFEYQQVRPNVWFLKRSTKYIFPKAGLAPSPDSANWTQKVVRTVTEISELKEPLQDRSFAVPLPEGTRVSDVIQGKTSIVGVPSKKSPKQLGTSATPRRRLWLVGVNVALIVAVGAWVWVRRKPAVPDP